MSNDFARNKDGKLSFTRDREFAAREAREQLAREHRIHLEKSGKHISHDKARRSIDKIADDIDKRR